MDILPGPAIAHGAWDWVATGDVFRVMSDGHVLQWNQRIASGAQDVRKQAFAEAHPSARRLIAHEDLPLSPVARDLRVVAALHSLQ